MSGSENTLPSFEIKDLLPGSARDDILDWGLIDVKAPSVWPKSRGTGIKVGILDTGVDLNHPDLQGAIHGGLDFTGSPSGVIDRQGHGTHVSGIIGARDNGIGIIGIAPDCELYMGKVLSDNGGGSFESIIAGLRWMQQQGVQVINMSLGAGSQPPEEMHRVIKELHDAGVLLIAATGNENHDVCWPALYDEVIAISAMDQAHNRASFSNYGIKNEIMAPGVEIMSTFKDGQYARLSGTSMATPMVTGCVALYLGYAKANGLPTDLESVHARLVASCDDLGVAGPDEYTGAGLINLEKLLA